MQRHSPLCTRKCFHFWQCISFCVSSELGETLSQNQILNDVISPQMPFDLASAEDVKCLLQDAMPSNVIIPTTSKLPTTAMTTSPGGRIDGAAAIVATIPSQSASKGADQVQMLTLALYFSLFRRLLALPTNIRIDKLQLTGQNLGRVFNFRSGHLLGLLFWCYW
jgi:hypothetical protein